MRPSTNIPKKLLGFKSLRRTASVLVLAMLDTAGLSLGLLAASRLPVSGSEQVPSLMPLLVGVWIVVCAAFRLYDRAPVRRNPGALIGASACWAGLMLAGGAVYPQSAPGPIAIVVGAEGTGVRPGVLAHCDLKVAIPMGEAHGGPIGSLNASVSAAVVLYEALRQRTGGPSP